MGIGGNIRATEAARRLGFVPGEPVFAGRCSKFKAIASMSESQKLNVTM